MKINWLRSVIVLFLIFQYSCLFAQADFLKGFIISNAGDTTFGLLSLRGDGEMSKICYFKSTNDKEVQTLTPLDIFAYRFDNGKFYITKEIKASKRDSLDGYKTSKVFMEFLIKGKLNVYYLWDEKGEHYYLQKEGEEMAELPYKEEIRDNANGRYYYKSKTHIGTLYNYTKDAPELRSAIENIETPKEKTLVELAEKYHNMVCKDQKCIIYKKKGEPIKVFIEANTGFFFDNSPFVATSPVYFGGGLLHFWFPGSRNIFFLKTGLLYSEFVYNKKNTKFFKVPIHFEVIANSKVFKPRGSIGANIYPNIYPTLGASGGFLLKIYHKLYLSLGVDIESSYEDFVYPQYINYGINYGLFWGF